MAHLSDSQPSCPSRKAAKQILVWYSVLSFVTGFTTGAALFAFFYLNNAYAARSMMEQCVNTGTLKYTTNLETCLSISSES